jgi:class 3 adenylate cyclase
MDVASWLRQLGLERYEPAFRENDVSAAVLPNLTAEDLRELGISSVGHRRLLLEAISALRADATAAGDLKHVSHSRTSSSEHSAERRQITVVFCDLIDSTALSSRLDPEDLSEVIRGYQSRLAVVIAQFGGFIARYVGDGVLIYFGWPEAHENNTERAVRAALAATSAISQTPIHGESLQLRIGIATGLVVVGAPIGTGEARQQTAIGETPNLAARLQGFAGPNGIAVDETTRKQFGEWFDCRDLGRLELKGFPEPVPAWLVLGERNVESRFEALRGGTLTPLIGRDRELALLQSCWRQAKEGAGQTVLVSGEAGIGKSRLIGALELRLESDAPTRLRYFCEPDQIDTALYPVITTLQHEARFARGDDNADRLRKLQTMLSPAATAAADVALIADLLSIPQPNRPPILDAGAQARKEATFVTLIARLQSLAQANPLLVILEDAHWADASSIEFFNAAIPALAYVPALLIISTRSDDTRIRIGGARISTLTLSRLDRRDAAALASSVTTGASLSPELLARIVDQTDGIPLFVEELTKVLVETASAGGEDVPITVPASLQASLMARLDRIPQAKEVAQVGAVIGREFPYVLLATVSGLPDMTVKRGLQQLIDAGLATCDGEPEASYSFKHALVRDTAYGMLLRQRRRELHARAAVALEEQSPELRERRPELLAHHYTEAGMAELAVACWSMAARRSVARSAMIEAAAQLRQALALVPELPEGAARLRQELELQGTYGGVLFELHSWADGSAAQAYARAQDLAERLGELGAIIPILAGVVTYHAGQCEYRTAREIAVRLLGAAERGTDQSVRMVAHRCMGVCLHWTGEAAGAAEHFDRVLALYNPTRDRQLATLLGFDARVQATYLSCWDLAILGHLDQALRRFELARTRSTMSIISTAAHSPWGMAAFSVFSGKITNLPSASGPKHSSWQRNTVSRPGRAFPQLCWVQSSPRPMMPSAGLRGPVPAMPNTRPPPAHGQGTLATC